MIKKICAVLGIVFIAVAATVIFYWKDNQFDPTSSDLLLYLLLLPLIITVIILTPWLIYRFYKARQQRKEAVTDEGHQVEAEPEQPIVTEWVKLAVYGATCKSALGEDSELVDALKKMPSPELDPTLVNAYGLPILSYRMQDLTDDQSDEEQLQSRMQRIYALIEQQLEQQYHVLAAIAAHLKQSSLFFETEYVHEYRMHPAWIDPDAVYTDEELANEPINKPVSQLNHLNLHIILSDHLLHVWDDAYCSQFIQDKLNALGFLSQKVQISYQFWSAQTALREWSALLKNIQKNQAEVSFILLADSEIDQDFIDEQNLTMASYIPAEFAASCCIANESVILEDLTPIKQIHLALNQKKFAPVLNELKLNDLAQYQSEQPFVVVPAEASERATRKQLGRQFEHTPIEAEHYLYVSASLGHSRNLAQIYAYFVAMQFSDEQTVFVPSVHEPIYPVVIAPVLPLEQQQEATA